jgi:hypothetical protein
MIRALEWWSRVPSMSDIVTMRRGRAAIIAAAIVLATTIAYLPVFHAGFVWDDHEWVEHNPDVRGPLWDVWAHPRSLDYWPLTWTSFWAESRVFGDYAPAMHVTNVLLHVLVALLLWRVLTALRVPGAALAGFLFALHPVAVESVAQIAEQKNTLSAVLVLAATWEWVRFERARHSLDAAASLALFTLACLAKTSVVMFPFVWLVISSRSRGTWKHVPWRWLAAFFGVALTLGAVTLEFQWTRAVGDELPTLSAAERVASAAWALLFYVRTAFVPTGLTLLYPAWPAVPGSPTVYVPAALVLAIGVALWTWRRRVSKGPLLALGYHVLMVLPVLGLVDMAIFRITPVANHLQYLALMGPAALGGAALAHAEALGWRRASATAGAGLVALLGGTAFHRATAFEDDLTLWRTAVRDAPQSYLASVRYSDFLVDAGRRDEAAEELVAFMGRTKDAAAWHRTRAILMHRLGKYDECAAALLKAGSLRSWPWGDVRFASALVQEGAAAEGARVLGPMMERWPRSVQVRYWLSIALVKMGRVDEAAAVLREGLRLHPGNRTLGDSLAYLPVGMRAPDR